MRASPSCAAPPRRSARPTSPPSPRAASRGDGQVLLKLEDEPPAFTVCPVGQAAYVHFPTAGVLDVLLARLGLLA